MHFSHVNLHERNHTLEEMKAGYFAVVDYDHLVISVHFLTLFPVPEALYEVSQATQKNIFSGPSARAAPGRGLRIWWPNLLM